MIMDANELIRLLPYFAIAVVGALAHIIAKLAKLEEKKSFKLKTWVKKNKYASMLSIILSIGGVFTLDSTGGLSMVAVFFMAYAMDSATKNGEAVIKK